MEQLKNNQQLIIAACLILLMLVTRYHHFGSVLHLADASWAIFFAGGFYLRSMKLFGAFLAAAAGIDYFAITQGGVSNYCISPAYGFLAPAYAALWLGGRSYQRYYRFKWPSLFPLAATTIISVSVCFLISNGAFYMLSGKFSDSNLTEYISRVMLFYPLYLKTTIGYIAALGVVHALFEYLHNNYGQENNTRLNNEY
jgi:hypothetical protein